MFPAFIFKWAFIVRNMDDSAEKSSVFEWAAVAS